MKNWYVRIFLSMLLMQSKNNSDIELLRALHSRNSKNIRNPLIFFKKWLLTHVFDGSQVQKSSCKQACIGFMTF